MVAWPGRMAGKGLGAPAMWSWPPARLRFHAVPTRDFALQVVIELALEQGLACVPETLAERSNLVLRLSPHRIVARVALAESAVRAGTAYLAREVSLSRFLTARGRRVTRPSERIAPGPFERGGLVVSFWELEDVRPEPADPQLAGAELAALHCALRDYPAESLPVWGAWTEASAALDRALRSATLDAGERRRLERAWTRGEAIVERSARESQSFQAVHGDAHVRNVISTASGPLWTDWEDAFLGPVEYDIAALRSRLELFGEEREAIESMCAAYDGPLDPALVRELGLVRNLQVIPWLAVFAERDGSLLPRMRARIACLPAL